MEIGENSWFGLWILGTLFFLLFTMDLGISLKNTQAKIHWFADDTVAIIKNNNLSEPTKDMEKCAIAMLKYLTSN